MLCFNVALSQYNHMSDIKHTTVLSCVVIIPMLPSFSLSGCAENACEI